MKKVTRNSPPFRFNDQIRCGYVALPLTGRLDFFEVSFIKNLPIAPQRREKEKKRRRKGKKGKERRMEAWKNIKLPPTDLEWLSGKRPNK